MAGKDPRTWGVGGTGAFSMTLSALALSASLYRALAASACTRTVAGDAATGAAVGADPETAGVEGGAIISRRISRAGHMGSVRKQAATENTSSSAEGAERPGHSPAMSPWSECHHAAHAQTQ